MEIISHREMRNRSGEILRRVENGESLQVTNNGKLTALIVPAEGNTLAGLIERGEARAPVSGRERLLATEPVSAEVSIAEILADVRGQW